MGSLSFRTNVTLKINFDITVTGDSYAANNTQNNIFAVSTAATASAIPYTENFESASAMPAKFKADDEGGFFFYGGTSPSIIGANGSGTKCVIVDYFDLSSGTTSDLLLTNYNTQAAANSSFEFDVAYAQFAASGTGSNDKLEVMVSTDCGTTWTSVWSKQGSALKTHAPVDNGQFVPTAATDWRHEGFSLNNYKNTNLYIKFKMTSDYGNFGFLDNFKVSNTTSIAEVVGENSVKVFPNPATDVVNVSFELTKGANVSVQVVDMVGRVVKTIADQNMNAGTQKLSVATTDMAPGIYNLKIQTEAGSRTERFTVVK